MTFEEWYRKNYPMSDDVFFLYVVDSQVYKAMEEAYKAGRGSVFDEWKGS